MSGERTEPATVENSPHDYEEGEWTREGSSSDPVCRICGQARRAPVHQ